MMFIVLSLAASRESQSYQLLKLLVSRTTFLFSLFTHDLRESPLKRRNIEIKTKHKPQGLSLTNVFRERLRVP